MMHDYIRIIFPVSMISVRLADDIFGAIARNLTTNEGIAFRIRTVLSEIFSNAFLYCEKEARAEFIEFEGCFGDDKFRASIINEGSGFTDNEDMWNEFPPAMAESGRGLKLIKSLSDNVEFIRHDKNKFEVRIEISMKKDKKAIKPKITGGSYGNSETL